MKRNLWTISSMNSKDFACRQERGRSKGDQGNVFREIQMERNFYYKFLSINFKNIYTAFIGSYLNILFHMANLKNN